MKKFLDNVNIGVLAFACLLLIVIGGCTNNGDSDAEGTGQATTISPDAKAGSLGGFANVTNYAGPGSEEKVKTLRFNSNADFLAFAKDYSGAGIGIAGGGYPMRYKSAMVNEQAVGSALSQVRSTSVPVSGESRSAADYSRTNNQVASVDEADILKSDGKYIYTVSGNVLYIIDAYPGEDAKVVATLKFNSTPQALLVEGDRLAVLGSFYDYQFFSSMKIRPRSGMSFMEVYDVSDKASPELIKDFKFEGSYFDARLKDGYAYFVTTSSLDYRRDHPTPILYDGNREISEPATSIYYFNIKYESPILVNIHSFQLKGASEASEVVSSSVAAEGSQQMYMSDSNIYITYTKYINDYNTRRDVTIELLHDSLSIEDRQLIAKIEATDSDVLTKYEKESRIYAVYSDYLAFLPPDEQSRFYDKIDNLTKKRLSVYEHSQYTVINRIAVDEGSIEPSANAMVPGGLLNQFSMDESNNVFRIATSLQPRWWIYSITGKQEQMSSGIYTLDMNLNLLGKKEAIMPGESIYSARFIGDRLYMVTFRQVDPFFVFDLSEPKDIKELGSLKIPGFSRYLHPYDENTIIGIGQDASESGRISGLKISLFDVSDVEHPTEIAKYAGTDKYAYSTALYEHKAFLFSKEKGLLVIPAYNYDYQDSGNNYNGALVFNVSRSGIMLRGLIDHSSGSAAYSPAVERSMYIDSMLYTKSYGLLRINDIGTLKTVKKVELRSESAIPVY